MSLTEKIAWGELLVSAVATVAVVISYPFWGEGSISFFALLGLLGFLPLLSQQRSREEVINDERDYEIEKQARLWGIGTAWEFLFLTVIAVILWHGFHKTDVPVKLLSALIWIQFALCYLVKGAVALYLYRKQRYGTEA